MTCLAFYDRTPNSGDEKLLITGSWEKARDSVYSRSSDANGVLPIDHQNMGY